MRKEIERAMAAEQQRKLVEEEVRSHTGLVHSQNPNRGEVWDLES